jgi:hypothetical protein
MTNRKIGYSIGGVVSAGIVTIIVSMNYFRFGEGFIFAQLNGLLLKMRIQMSVEK